MADKSTPATFNGRGITYNVFNPDTCANPVSDRWLCEIRNNGWIADWKRFDTPEEAEEWGKNHDGEMSDKACREIVAMANRWANK